MGRPRKKISVGDVAHRLTVVEPPYTKLNSAGTSVWWVKVRCSCPVQTIKDIRVSEFGSTVSCGCYQRESSGRPVLAKNQAAPGTVFGRFTVLEIVRRNGIRVARCRCSCEAQTVKDVPIQHLIEGNVKSCGCYNREVARQRMLERGAPKGVDHPGYKHGLSLKGNKHPNYARWRNMMDRCYKVTDPSYHSYGAIGITVHTPWHDVAVFVREMDELLGPCPEGRSLDRIDVYGNYEPGNLQWATPQQQSANRHDSKLQLRPLVARRVQVALREQHPGHSQDWYVDFIEQVVLKAVGL